MKKEVYLTVILFLSLLSRGLFAQVQINPPFAMPDVNIIQDGDRAYAFCGTDLDPYNFEIETFIMPYWRCYSSTDLINWRFESMLRPEDTYIGETDKCFAGHGIKSGDKWYWYFSNYIKSVGVAVADSPRGPWKDVLGKPLLPEDISITHEYDPCAFIDEDGKKYMIFGSWIDRTLCYHIAEMNDDMISLKEEPKRIIVNNAPEGPGYLPVDASFMHKYNGLYYLSWRRPYAVSKNIYGPYEYTGRQDAMGHLGFFTFNKQWFVNYTTLKDGYRRRYRFASIAYVHFNEDGSIAAMEPLVREHGVGQYNAGWDAIEAEWYMNASPGPEKKMLEKDHFCMANLRDGDFLFYPYIHDCKYNSSVEISYSCSNNSGGTIIIKAGSENGFELGRAEFEPTSGWDDFRTLNVQLDKNPQGTISIAFVFQGKSGDELLRMDSFRLPD